MSEDEETRKLYKSVLLGPHVELLVLDTRRGYLGKNQGKWLKGRLINSTATWKVVLSGTSFGRMDIAASTSSDQTASVKEENNVNLHDNQGKLALFLLYFLLIHPLLGVCYIILQCLFSGIR